MKNIRFENIHKVSDIVDTMIRGLKNEWVKIDMDTFGSERNGVCFGCAATNTLCELMQQPFSTNDIEEDRRHEIFNYGITYRDFTIFERAINYLRLGYLSEFMRNLDYISYTTGVYISSSSQDIVKSYLKPKWWRKTRKLPVLYNSNYITDLLYYEKFRDWLIKKGF